MADKDFRVKLGLHVGANAYIEGNITSVDSIQMNIASPTAVGGAGQLAWNIDENTIDVGMNANTTLQLGQEQYYYVKNQTGSLIPDGTVVMANGTVGASGRIKVAPAVANGTFPSKYIIGITTEDIPDGGDGFVTAFGKVRDIDTSMFNEGDILYANPAVAGGLANTVPVAPNNIVTVAIVINKHATNGTLFVRPIYGSNLLENEALHVEGVTDGQALVYVTANSRFENKTVSGTSSDSFKTISVSGQSNVVADSSTDVLTFVAGSGITITTDEANDAITFTSTSGGGDASNAWVNANDAATLLSAYSNDYSTLLSAYANDKVTTVSVDNSTNDNFFILATQDVTGDLGSTVVANAKISYNPSTGTVSSNAYAVGGSELIGSARNLTNYAVTLNARGSISGSQTIDLALGNFVTATATGSITWTFSNASASHASGFVLELTNGGSAAQIWPGSVRWPGGTAPTLTASGVDVLVFVTDDAGTNWRGAASMLDSKAPA